MGVTPLASRPDPCLNQPHERDEPEEPHPGERIASPCDFKPHPHPNAPTLSLVRQEASQSPACPDLRGLQTAARLEGSGNRLRGPILTGVVD